MTLKSINKHLINVLRKNNYICTNNSAVIDFIKEKTNSKHIHAAQRQQKDICYFTESSLQQEITYEYLKQWAERKYTGNDRFLNWVKNVFRTDNFLSFYKYLRFPLVSAKIVNDEIKPQLKRVFHAEDSFFKYTVNNKEVECPVELKDGYFKNAFFEAILFDHNAIVVHDLDDINKPYREIISINHVVAVESHCGKIERVAYLAELKVDDKVIHGFAYMDAERYAFLDRDYNVISDVPHDLGECPADWLSSENFSKENDIVKKSIFSYVKPDLEEYVFLKTLQKMTEPNGAIPVTVKLKGNVVDKSGRDIKGTSEKEPMASNTISQQQASQTSTVNGGGNDNQLQAGTIISVPTNKDANGKIDSDIVGNYFKFHYIPIEALNYLNDRLKEIPVNIINAIVGDYQEQQTQAVNELQVGKSYDNKQDKLRWVSYELTRISTLSAFKTLALKYGKDNVKVDLFFGSDFFLETSKDLYDQCDIAPNAIERRTILARLAQSRNKFNPQKAERDSILYKLMPYATDKDFDTANAKGTMDYVTFEYQTRFMYWITMFEANYGEITMFWNEMDIKESEKLLLINKLIKQIIVSEVPKPVEPIPATAPTK